MKKLSIIFFFLTQFRSMHAQVLPDSIIGTYFLQGVMETASVLELKADSSFDFFYSYGAVDRAGSGKWSIVNHELILNSRKRPPADFKMLESKTRPDSNIIIQIADKNKALVSYVQCIINTTSGDHEGASNSEGIISFSKESLNSISLIFRLCPDRYSVFEIKDKSFNFFQFGFETWIPEIFFEHVRLTPGDKRMTGQHPLLKGENFTYLKE